jgi:hypothetical protein
MSGTGAEGRQSPLPPLPAEPPWPVFGVPDFAGARWLELWDIEAGSLAEVLLGHGYDDGPMIVTITRGSRAVHPMVQVVAVRALIGMVHLAVPISAETGSRPPGFGSETARMIDVAVSELPSWETEKTTVDGSPVYFRVRRCGTAWAAVADLGSVAAGAYGQYASLSQHPLRDARPLEPNYRPRDVSHRPKAH